MVVTVVRRGRKKVGVCPSADDPIYGRNEVSLVNGSDAPEEPLEYGSPPASD
jgi:hypothetical protein